jgi:hypothetical protein
MAGTACTFPFELAGRESRSISPGGRERPELPGTANGKELPFGRPMARCGRSALSTISDAPRKSVFNSEDTIPSRDIRKASSQYHRAVGKRCQPLDAIGV